MGRSAFQEGLAGALGGRGRGSAVGKGWIYTSYAGHAVLWVKTRPFPASPLAAKTVLQPPPATAIFPRRPAGRTAGSARTRSRVQTLENPFLGTAAVSPSPPFPQRRRRQAPAHGLAAVCSLHRPNRTETQSARPLLVGRALVNTAPTATGRRHCRPEGRRCGRGRRSVPFQSRSRRPDPARG